MTTWDDFAAACPGLADRLRGRFEEHGLAFLATLRRDGMPRISGIEPLIADGELWVGMMPGSRKVDDVRRDPRVALHGASIDKEVAAGDVKLTGRLVEVTDPARVARFAEAFRDANGYGPEPPFPLFTVDILDATSLRPQGDHLEIELWSATAGLRRMERR